MQVASGPQLEAVSHGGRPITVSVNGIRVSRRRRAASGPQAESLSQSGTVIIIISDHASPTAATRIRLGAQAEPERRAWDIPKQGKISQNQKSWSGISQN
jgi:hypothetical protein